MHPNRDERGTITLPNGRRVSYTRTSIDVWRRVQSDQHARARGYANAEEYQQAKREKERRR